MVVLIWPGDLMLRNGSKFRLMIYFEIAFNLISIICQKIEMFEQLRDKLLLVLKIS